MWLRIWIHTGTPDVSFTRNVSNTRPNLPAKVSFGRMITQANANGSTGKRSAAVALTAALGKARFLQPGSYARSPAAFTFTRFVWPG